MKVINNKLSLNHPLAFLSFTIVLAGLITALMFYYSTSYSSLRPFVYGNSDMLTIPALYNDVVNGVDISNWKLSEASFFFPDMLLYFLARSATPSIFAALSVYGIVQYLFFTLGLVFLAKQIFPGSYGSAPYSMIALMAMFFSFSIDKLHWLSNTIFVNSHHFGVVATIPWVLAMSFQLISKPQLKTSLVSALCILSFLTSASDTLYIIQITVPLCGSLIILFLIKKICLKRMIVINSAIILASVAGLGLKYVIPWKYPTLQSYFNPSFMSLFNFVESIKSIILTTPYQAALAAFFVSICIFILIKSIISHISRRNTSAICLSEIIFPLYFLVATIVNVLAMVGSGKMCGPTCLRYFLPFFFFTSWWGLALVFKIPKFIKPARFERAILVVLALTVILALGNINLQQMVKNTTDVYYPSFVKCMDENTAQMGIKYGIAHYWQARPISMLTQNSLKVVQVNPDLTPFHWLNNLTWYEIEPEFVIIDLSIPVGDPGHLDENLVRSRYGEPDAIFQCEDSRILVYNRSDSKFRTLFNNILQK